MRKIIFKKSDNVIILGVDPGLALVGYGIIEVIGNRYKYITHGVIKTEAGVPFQNRLKKIYEEMTEIVIKYKPGDIAFEELFFNKNIKTAITVAQARGVEVLVASTFTENIYEYTPLQVKQAIVGYGRAEKKQVQEMTRMILNLEEIPKPDDAADALAIAITHANSINFKESFLMK